MKDNEVAIIKDPKLIKWDELDKYDLTKKGKAELRTFMLNQVPADGWIKKHPLYKNDYLPIDKVEFLLTIFFKKWYVEILNVYQIANSVCCNIRLFYLDPDTNEYDHQDGAGAAPMQVNSGSNAMDQANIKSNAVMLALPIAKTNAVKDAADQIGKLFGRDLNRRGTLQYDTVVKKFEGARLIEK